MKIASPIPTRYRRDHVDGDEKLAGEIKSYKDLKPKIQGRLQARHHRRAGDQALIPDCASVSFETEQEGVMDLLNGKIDTFALRPALQCHRLRLKRARAKSSCSMSPLLMSRLRGQSTRATQTHNWLDNSWSRPTTAPTTRSTRSGSLATSGSKIFSNSQSDRWRDRSFQGVVPPSYQSRGGNNTLTLNRNTWAWHLLTATILFMMGAGLWVAAKKIDYLGAANRVPQYFLYHDETVVSYPF